MDAFDNYHSGALNHELLYRPKDKYPVFFLNLDPLDDLSDLPHHLRHCIRYHLKEG